MRYLLEQFWISTLIRMQLKCSGDMLGQKKSWMKCGENVLFAIGLLQFGLGAVWGGIQEIIVFSSRQVRRSKAENGMDMYVSFTMAENQTREKRNGRLSSPPALPVLAALDHSTTFYTCIQIW